jgi:hypothetical protein
VNAVAFTAAGRRLVTGSGDHADMTVKVWDTVSSQELYTFTSPGANLGRSTYTFGGNRTMNLAVADDGRIVAGYGTLGVLDCRPLSPAVREEREARGLLHWLFHKPLAKAEVVEAVRRDDTVAEPVRRLALQLVENYRDRPEPFNDAAWAVVYRADASPDDYRRALDHAAAAHRLAPADAEYAVTLAVAQYRAGQYQQAIDTLAKVDKEAHAHPEIEVVEAMAAYRLGRREEARAAVAAFRKQFDGRKASSVGHLRAVTEHFLTEAEGLLAARPDREPAPPPRPGK